MPFVHFLAVLCWGTATWHRLEMPPDYGNDGKPKNRSQDDDGNLVDYLLTRNLNL